MLYDSLVFFSGSDSHTSFVLICAALLNSATKFGTHPMLPACFFVNKFYKDVTKKSKEEKEYLAKNFKWRNRTVTGGMKMEGMSVT